MESALPKMDMRGATPEGASVHARFAEACRLYDAQRFGAAEALCRTLATTAPNELRVTLIWAASLSALRRHDEAIALLRPATDKYPNAASVQFCMGNVHLAANRLSQAEACFRRAAELQPAFAAAHCNRGLVLEQMTDFVGAVAAYERSLLLQPDLPEAHANLGRALTKTNRLEDAISHIRRAIALNPTAAKNHLLLGSALHRTGAYIEAANCCRRAIDLEPEFGEAHGMLAQALTSQQQIVEAVPHFRKAAELKPDAAMCWVALGGALSSLGRFAEAIACFEKAIALDANLGEAHRALAISRAWTGAAGHLEPQLCQIVTNIDLELPARGAAALAMAKILDDAGRYDDAFAAATEGNRLLRQDQRDHGLAYDHENFKAGNDTTMRVFSGEFIAARKSWGNRSELPVFVVGSFRSGTTLVEQICASHSEIFGAGELPEIPQLWDELRAAAPTPAHWTRATIREKGDSHVARLRELGAGARRVIDKMPDNIFLLGLIAILFPCARVIVCHRDGRDVALSNFFQRFSRRIDFATDLLDAGRRWRECERVATYWTETLPLSIHHVQYERLVADFEAEARALIDFLDLAWEPRCLEFHKTERLVLTASAWQVRQQLYSSSVGRWRRYRAHLGPLCAELGIAPDAPTGNG